MSVTRSNGTVEGSGIQAAADWLAKNRQAVSGALIPCLRGKFGLTALEAIEASKLAHQLEYDEPKN